MRVLLALSSLRERRDVVAALEQFVCLQDITTVSTGSEFVARLRGGSAYDVALIARMLPDFAAEYVITRARAAGNCPPILVLSAERGRNAVIACLRAGARDYLPLSDAGRSARLETRVRSVVAQVRRERQFWHDQKAECILSLASGVAQDLNNGLVAVLGKASLLQRELAAGSKQARYCEAVLDGAERLAEAAQQLVAYAGGGQYQPTLLDVNDCVSVACARLDSALTRGVHMQSQTGPRLWPVEADEAMITQLLVALMANACEAMPGGGTLTALTENSLAGAGPAISPEDAGAGEYVHICVGDTGTGIDPQVRARIFDPFVTTRGLGRGLGLAAVAGTVTRHGGFITVESEHECGTHIHVYLPRAGGTRSVALSAAERQGCVLVVEDDPDVREVEVEILEQHGYRVLTACDGLSAIETYVRHALEIDVVLLDMKLPGMPGEEVYRALAHVNPEIRVVVCTGYTQDSAAAGVLKHCSVSSFLPKPFTPKRLLQQTQAVMQA